MNLETLPFVSCNHRAPRPGRVDYIVVHTNEGPEGARSAEGLASYLHGPKATAGYNVVVDEDSAVRLAQDSEMVWGAGGVNSRAWHICLIGFSAQTPGQWHDPASSSTRAIAADLVRQAAAKLGVPTTRIFDTRSGTPRGICGHVDVSRYHKESMGHTDPGPNFPWDEFMAAVKGGVAPVPEDEVEHGMAVDIVVNPGNPAQGYTLTRWGSIHGFGGARAVTGGPSWQGQDVARRLVITDWSKPAGYVLDLRGGVHGFGGNKNPSDAGYWASGEIVPFTET